MVNASIVYEQSKKIIAKNISPYSAGKTLSLGYGVKIASLDPILEFPKLEEVTFGDGLSGIPDLTPLIKLPNLRTVNFYGSLKPKNIEELLGCDKLENLGLRSTAIKDYTFLNKFPPKLKQIELVCSSVKDLSPLRSQIHLTDLTVKTNKPKSDLTDISVLKNMKELRNLDLSGARITSFNTIASHDLETLDISFCDFIKSFEGLENCTRLTSIQANFVPLTTLTHLKNMSKLTDLKVRRSNITSLDGIGKLNLESLYAEKTKLKTLEHIDHMPKLKLLWIFDTDVSDLSPLANAPALEELNLANCKKIKDFSPLLKLNNLKELDLYATTFSNLNILEKLPKLKAVRIPIGISKNKDVQKIVKTLEKRMLVSFSAASRWSKV